MSATVSLIDPTTLNPSFSDRPGIIITRTDQQTSAEQLQLLLTDAKAYRLQMMALSKAAANFGYALEKIAHSKAAVRDSSNVSSNLQAAAGLHYLMSNHHQILGDMVYKQFEIPLLEHLDTYRVNIETNEVQYERSMKAMKQKINETEAVSMAHGRKGQRDLLQYRQFLATLSMQVDELERIKLGYYFANMEAEQAHLQLILQKTSAIVRAEVDIYEHIASKGLSDVILESVNSGESVTKKTTFTSTVGSGFKPTAEDTLTKKSVLSSINESSKSTHSTKSQARVTGTAKESSDKNAPSSEMAVQTLAVQVDSSSQRESVAAEVLKEPKELDVLQEAREPEDATNSQQPSNSSQTAGEHQDTPSSTLNHDNTTVSKDDLPASIPSEKGPPSSCSFLLASRPGSGSNLALPTTPESLPVRGSMHISQDSELLNNRDFSFPYEPSELPEKRSRHSRLHLSRHDAQSIGGFVEEDEDDDFTTTPSTGILDQSINNSSLQLHSRDSSHHSHRLRHHTSDGQLSQKSSSSYASSVADSRGGIKMDHDTTTTAAAFLDTSLEESFGSSVVMKEQHHQQHMGDLRRGFDDGMPAFYADEMKDPQGRRLTQPRQSSLKSSSPAQASRPQSQCDEQDHELPFQGSNVSVA
ncbi:hypothetical protein BGZ65_005982 [Modicella reniformis]|uniref:Uncharacterized protein n=1 Tax=Modicella reniformis TaxID=1440133 RepID=A0A9P6JHG8_9FUNG|nr:hypothetical protein BGZ65_005982 [Modicella reniformis]